MVAAAITSPIASPVRGLAAFGAEALIDTGFNNSAAWANVSGSWTVAGGVATHTPGVGGSVAQPVFVVAGATYEVTYTLTRTVGTLRPRLSGGTNVLGTLRSTNGTFTENIVAVEGNNTLDMISDAASDDVLDNVQFRRVA